MRRGVVVTMSFVTLAVAGLSLRAGDQAADRTVSKPATPAATSSAQRSKNPPRRSSTPPATRQHRTPSSAAGVSRAISVQGDVVDTEYGPVRVRITVRSGRIVEARAIERPHGDGTTEQINGYAVPVLNQEVAIAQGAGIDTVSGATFTSAGYRQSLQSALDAAHRSGAL